MPIDAELHFKPVEIHYDIPEQNINWIQDWEYFGGVLLDILFKSADKLEVLGSGILEAPGVALTAKHVIEH